MDPADDQDRAGVELRSRGLARLGPSTASIIGLVNPAVGVLLGLLLLHESFGLLDAVGLGLILGSVLLGQERVRRVVAGRWGHVPPRRVPVGL